jgi:3-hydroxybutyryl-CoA dehydratase
MNADFTNPSSHGHSSEPPLVAGASLPVITRHVTQAMIDAYAEASGDFNPIHVDPDFARTGPFGRTIAHGLMTLAFAAQLLNEWTDGKFDECGEIDVAFVSPVFTGDDVKISGVVEDIAFHEGQPTARVRLICTVGDRQILAGTATQPIQPWKET